MWAASMWSNKRCIVCHPNCIALHSMFVLGMLEVGHMTMKHN